MRWTLWATWEYLIPPRTVFLWNVWSAFSTTDSLEVHLCLEGKMCAGQRVPMCSCLCTCGWLCMCCVCLPAGVTHTATPVFADGAKTLQSVLDVDFVWQSPAFCGVPGLLWAEFQV